MSPSAGSLQVERRQSEVVKLEEEQETGREERPDACEEAEEEEEVCVDSSGPGSSREEGMQSHVSRSENLEKLNISRMLQDKHSDSELQQQNTANKAELQQLDV